MSRSQAIVETRSGSRYLQQLCKHWGHRFEVEFTPEKGRIDLGEGRVCLLEAQPDRLIVQAEAPPETLEKFQEIVAAHILRFAHREPDLRFDWRDDF